MFIMNMRLVAVCLILAISVATCDREAHLDGTSEKLNVLFITIDDLNTSLGCYGNPIIKTPNIDRLARQGVRFDRSYCQFSICNPSRMSFLSGRRPQTTRVLTNNTVPGPLMTDVVFLPEHFRQNGYFTAHIGKIAHDKLPDPIEWDFAEPSDRSKRKTNCPRRKPHWCPVNTEDDEEPDGRVARRVIQMLRENLDRPFFIAAGFSKPHLPWIAPKKYFDMYPPEAIPPPVGNPGNNMTPRQAQEAKAAYYACISFVDAQIGLILDALEESNVKDKTIVVLLGDHGFHLGDHNGKWGKKSLFEEVARVPLIISAPGKLQGFVLSQMIELVDLYPTLSSFCNLPAPAGIEGTSFTPLFDAPGRQWKQAVFTDSIRGENGPLEHSVRTNRYVYLENADGKMSRLFDHETDPAEAVNLAKNPAHRQTLSMMKQLLREGWKAVAPIAD